MADFLLVVMLTLAVVLPLGWYFETHHSARLDQLARLLRME